MTALPKSTVATLRDAQGLLSGNNGMILNLALSYGGRFEIVTAARRFAQDVLAAKVRPDELTEARFAGYLMAPDLPDPDLLIRTSGEMRLSNFLLWQLAYAELYVTEVLWPDFRERDLLTAIANYQQRDRRFGGL
jgi:undecaprenyl diphosphate synthase